MSPAILLTAKKSWRNPPASAEPFPGLSLVELPESNWCCGSAGIYNLIQPEMANELLIRKLNHIGQLARPWSLQAIRDACFSSSTAQRKKD